MAEDVRRHEAVEALGALYGAERQDATAFVNTRLALMALQLTYLGLAVVALSRDGAGLGDWVTAFIAFPLWFLHGYHVILVAMSMARVESAKLVEDELYRHSGLADELRDRVGMRAGQRLADIALQPMALKVQAGVSYAGLGLAMVAFTVYSMIVTARIAGWVSPPVLLAGLLYLFLMGAAAAVWWHVAHLPRDASGD